MGGKPRGARRGGSRLDDAQFRRAVEEARNSFNISDVVGRRTTLKRSGTEHYGLCVFHNERSGSLW
ncbi:CHC2 zinc finger domain-containing protein [Sphingomonas adhaesiva]|uniref:CHC2 zinc finger domain-containing protein n=1 Tax=Sphingomonas adhaesiva TaxID=28212 RepID=UPI002FFCE531